MNDPSKPTIRRRTNVEPVLILPEQSDIDLARRVQEYRRARCELEEYIKSLPGEECVICGGKHL